MVNRKLRTGRKVGRTIYLMLNNEPSDNDPLIGVVDTPEFARKLVYAWNTCYAREDNEEVTWTN